MQSSKSCRRGSAPPKLPGVFLPKRTAFLCIIMASPALGDDEPIARFETGSQLLVVSVDDIAHAAPLFGDQGAGLSFELIPATANAFANLTERAIGQTLSFYVCDDLLVSAVVRERISGRGHATLESLGDANYYARVLNGEISC